MTLPAGQSVVGTAAARPLEGSTPSPGLIGLLGGTTWLSTLDYYRYLNEAVARQQGGLHSARILLHSVDFGAVVACEAAGDLAGEQRILIDAARSLQRGGAALIALCANTAHVHLDTLQAAVDIPIVSIIDAIASEIRQAGYTRVAVLSTARTRASGLLGDTLGRSAGCDILQPDDTQQQALDHLIRDGAAAGGFDAGHAGTLQAMLDDLRQRGAQAVVLGCTELPQVLAGLAPALPGIDSTRTHVKAILAAATSG